MGPLSDVFLLKIAACVLCLLVYYAYRCMIVVRPRKVAIVERYGAFHRELRAGVHFLWHPFDGLLYTTWSYTDQEGSKCHVTTCFVSMDLRQMDTPPIKCVSRETTPIEVDVTVMYKVIDVARAMYEVHDSLNYFYQCVLQATRDVCGTIKLTEMQGHDHSIGDRIVQYTNELMGQDKGIECVKCIVQNVALSPEVLQERQKRYEAEEQHRRKMDVLKHEEAMQKRQHALLLEKSKFEAEREYDRRVQELKPYLDHKFTPDQVVALKTSEAISNAKRVTVFMGDAPAMHWVTKK